MSWANPGAAIFLLLIPAVILLYFLRLRRDDKLISSTLLWSRVLEDRRVNAPFQRLKKSLLLFLQILAIAILAAALARPELESDELPGLTHIIMMDVSGSMATVEQGGTRLEEAKRLAVEYAKGIGGNERGVVLHFARGTRAVTPVTADVDVLVEAIEAMEVHPARTSIDAALELALSIANNQVDALAIVFSDGGFPSWDGGEIPLPVQYVPVGTDVPNSGIVALDSRMNLSVSPRPQIFVELRNYSSETTKGELTIFQDGQAIRADDPEMKPNGRWNGSFEAMGDGLIEVRWDPEGSDALDLDNKAWLFIPERRDLTVWRVGEPRFFLDDALAVIPNVVVEQVVLEEIETRLAAGDEPPDVVLWDGVSPERLPDVSGHLFFQRVQAGQFLSALPPGIWDGAERREFPEIVTWNRSHPVNRFLSYKRNTVISESYIFSPRPGTTSLLDTTDGGLISTFVVPGARGVCVGFDPVEESDWPLDLSFPLFFYNTLSYLASSNASTAEGVRGDELLKWKPPAGVTEVELLRPDGETLVVGTDGDGWIRYSDTDRLGPIRLSWTEIDEDGEELEFDQLIPVNLLSADESDPAPQDTLEIAGRKVEATDQSIFKDRNQYWPWILAAAILLLLVEWYCYHRR